LNFTWRLGWSICVGLELQKGQQYIVSLAGEMAKIGAAQRWSSTR